MNIAQKFVRSLKPKLDEEIEKLVFKQGNYPLNNVSLVIRVCSIVLRLFSPRFSEVHCKNILTMKHPDPMMVSTHT